MDPVAVSAVVALIFLGGTEVDLKPAFRTAEACETFKAMQHDTDLKDAKVYCVPLPTGTQLPAWLGGDRG